MTRQFSDIPAEYPSSHVLREVKQELTPRVPELAAQLFDNAVVFRQQIEQAVERHDADPARVTEANYIKVEQHVLAGFLLDAMGRDLVSGSGPDATLNYFRRDDRGLIKKRSPDDLFMTRYRLTHRTAAENVEVAYGHGDTPETNWLAYAQDRYRRLGDRIRVLKEQYPTSEYNGVEVVHHPTNENRELRIAMRSDSLVPGLHNYINMLQRSTTLTTSELYQAAHDLTHLLIAPANLHVTDFFYSGAYATEDAPFLGEVRQDVQAGQYYIDYAQTDSQGLQLRHVPRRLRATAKLRCPMHDYVDVDPLTVNTQANRRHLTPDGSDYTNLQNLAHAAINQAFAEGLFLGAKA